MGCICSKKASENEEVDKNEKDKELNKPSVQLVANASSNRGEFQVSNRRVSKALSQTNSGPVHAPLDDSKHGHQIYGTTNTESSGGQGQMSRIISLPHSAQGEQIVAGWPSWLTSVAGDAINGWVPRRADSFEKLLKIGQGTYSSVYKARDLETSKIVAMKKVRFVNMDPESVRFMAREIYTLRKLDHPNVMKLEALVASRMSCSLYLIFEYMEHDLAGLAATPGIKFTEPQIKCYMQQLLCGLEHCHSRGVLHRDIKCSNLLIDNNGVLKIGDFGLATFYQPDQNQPLTSRVVTLWYRAPELLLGATEYGVAIDMWSTGCILAELFAGKPIMPGRTEVEQIHKIFKLCGSPSESYWQKTKLPHATSFKPQHPYKRRITDTFKDFPSSAVVLIQNLLAIEPEDRGTGASALRSEFFTTMPLPCNPSSLPKYTPSKEFDVKLRGEEAKRRKAEAVKGRGPESVRRGSKDIKEVLPTPDFNAQGDIFLPGQSNPKTLNDKYNPGEDGLSGFPIEAARGARQNGYSHSSSMFHPSAVGSSCNNKMGSTRCNADLRTQSSHIPHAAAEFSDKDPAMGYVLKKSRIHHSGPLVPQGENTDDMLREHERKIQEAVRKSRVDKKSTNKSYYEDYGQLHYQGRNAY